MDSSNNLFNLLTITNEPDTCSKCGIVLTVDNRPFRSNTICTDCMLEDFFAEKKKREISELHEI